MIEFYLLTVSGLSQNIIEHPLIKNNKKYNLMRENLINGNQALGLVEPGIDNSGLDFDLKTHLKSLIELLYTLDHDPNLTLKQKDLLGKALPFFGQALLTCPDSNMDD